MNRRQANRIMFRAEVAQRTALARQPNPPATPKYSGVFRMLTAADKAWLADRAKHMRNVYYHYVNPSTATLTPEAIEFIAGMAATGLLGDDGDAGTRHALKFKSAMNYASMWLATNQIGPVPLD